MQLASGLDALRLSLHVLAATVWVGGQIVMMGLVPTARALSDETAPVKLARAFARVSWPAFWILVVTGFWNMSALHGETAEGAWNTVMGVKLIVVALAGLGAFLHGRAKGAAGKAAWGSISGLASITALVLGVLLSG